MKPEAPDRWCLTFPNIRTQKLFKKWLKQVNIAARDNKHSFFHCTGRAFVTWVFILAVSSQTTMMLRDPTPKLGSTPKINKCIKGEKIGD
jgi:hypothetical protein